MIRVTHNDLKAETGKATITLGKDNKIEGRFYKDQMTGDVSVVGDEDIDLNTTEIHILLHDGNESMYEGVLRDGLFVGKRD